MSETYEARLARLFSGWTDAEVVNMSATMSDVPEFQNVDPKMVTWHDVWREYARRAFPENVVCKRCGSDNHTAETHDHWVHD